MNYIYKVCVIGSHLSGKTTLIQRLAGRDAVSDVTTIRREMYGKSVHIKVWDTDRFQLQNNAMQLAMRGSSMAVLTFDLTDRKSYNNISFYVQKVLSMEPDAQLVFVGTKRDLISPAEQRIHTSLREIKQLARMYEASAFCVSLAGSSDPHFERFRQEFFNIIESSYCVRQPRPMNPALLETQTFEESAPGPRYFCGC